MSVDTKVLLKANEIPALHEAELRFVETLRNLFERKYTAGFPNMVATVVDKEIDELLSTSIPADVTDRIHVFPYENVPEALRMSLLVQHLRSSRTASSDFRYLTAQIYSLLFEQVFAEAYSAVGTPAVVDTCVDIPHLQRSSQLVPKIEVDPAIAVFMRAGLYPSLVIGKEFERHDKSPSYALFRIRRNGHGTREELEYVLNWDDNVKALDGKDVFVPEPMLATAGSLLGVYQHIRRRGISPKSLTLLATISSFEGAVIAARAIPELRIFTAWLDPVLNSKGYILPGLGDAGDRLNGNAEHVGELLKRYGEEFCRVHEKQIESLYTAMKQEPPGSLF